MKGIVFTEFLKFVEDNYGAKAADDLIDAGSLPSGGVYTSVGTYDHEEIHTLVAGLVRQSGHSKDDILYRFGQILAQRFVLSHPSFFQQPPTFFDFLESVDKHIHVEVRKLYPDAELPSLQCRRQADGTMQLDYRSSRQLEALAAGLIQGAADFFGDKIRIARDHHGAAHDKFVRFSIELLPGAEPQP